MPDPGAAWSVQGPVADEPAWSSVEGGAPPAEDTFTVVPGDGGANGGGWTPVDTGYPRAPEAMPKKAAATGGHGRFGNVLWSGIAGLAAIIAVLVIVWTWGGDGGLEALCDGGVCLEPQDKKGEVSHSFGADAENIVASLAFDEPKKGQEVSVYLAQDEETAWVQTFTLTGEEEGPQDIVFEAPDSGYWLPGVYLLVVEIDAEIVLTDEITVTEDALPPFPAALAGHYRCAKAWDEEAEGPCDVALLNDVIEIGPDGSWSYEPFSGIAIASEEWITLYHEWGEPWRDGAYDVETGLLSFAWALEGRFTEEVEGDLWSRVEAFDDASLAAMAGVYRCYDSVSPWFDAAACASGHHIEISARGKWGYDTGPTYELARTLDGKVFFFQSEEGPPEWGLAEAADGTLVFLSYEGDPVIAWYKVKVHGAAEHAALVGEYGCAAVQDAQGRQDPCGDTTLIALRADGRYETSGDAGVSSGPYVYENDAVRFYATDGSLLDEAEVQKGALVFATVNGYFVFTKDGQAAPSGLTPTRPLPEKSPEERLVGTYVCAQLADGGWCPSTDDEITFEAGGTFQRYHAGVNGTYGGITYGSWTIRSDGRVRLSWGYGSESADLRLRADGVLEYPTAGGTELWVRTG